MRPEETPFRPGWWGTGLEDAGLEQQRPQVGTYGRYDSALLPALPFPLTGDFEWLRNAEVRSSNIGDERLRENIEALFELQQACTTLGISLPPTFIHFFETPALQSRIRSNTDCFLDLSASVTPSPVGTGHMIRFLSDSQGCVFWYLYTSEDGLGHAVVSSADFYGPESERWSDEEPDPAQIVFAAESFEEFICRFWLENEIWFAEYEKSPLPEGGEIYIRRYKGT
jgi:hypothetical protein